MSIIHWNTLLGRRITGLSIAPTLLWGVGSLALLPALLGLLGVDLSLDKSATVEQMAFAAGVPLATMTGFLHSLFEWTAALMALIIACFALAHCQTERSPEALILAAVLPAVAILDALHAFTAWTPHGAEQVSLAWWWLSRCLLALAPLAGGLVALHLPALRGRDLVLLCLGLDAVFLGVALFAPSLLGPASSMLRPDQPLLPRPFELVPLLLFAAAGLFVFPELHRRRPSVLNHALIISTLPQIVAQAAAGFGSLYPLDGADVAAHLARLTAYAVFFSGVLLDYVSTQRSRADAVHGFESAQLELRTRTQELVRVDRELVDQDIKRRRAERSLRILEKAVETMSLGVTVTDMEGRILYVNPADARMHGYTVDELLGKNARLYSAAGIPPAEDSDSVFLHPWARERTNVTRDGHSFEVRLVSDMVRDDQDRPIALVTLCEDISERKRIEAALERRDRVLEAVGLAAERFLANDSWETSVGEVLESLKAATGVERIELRRVGELAAPEIDDDWNALDNNRDTWPIQVDVPSGEIFPRWEKALRRGRLLQGRIEDLPEAEQEVLEARGVRSFAVVPIFVDDTWLGFLSLEDGDEDREWSPAELDVLRTAARTFGAAFERRRAEMALTASQARYQDLLESASDLVLSISAEGRFQFVNRAWKEALGYAPEEIGRLSLWDVVRPDYHEACREVLDKIARGGGVERVEVIFVTKSGHEIYVEGSLNARFVNERLVATRGIFRDITERKLVDRMKSEFISTVSHELRTPLTSIIASLGLLQSGRLDVERGGELVAVAHRNSNRLLQLINDLLDLQKLAAGKIVYRLKPIEAQGLLEEALRGIRSFGDSFDVELVQEEVDPELFLLADRDRLIQVLNNLLSNAIKFSNAGQKVHVGARVVGEPGEEKVEIAVADRGPGIPEEFQGRLFERFTQVDSSATRSAGGSGLGLSIVKGLVEGMGGEVFLETRIDQGTTFYVALPLAEAPSRIPSRR